MRNNDLFSIVTPDSFMAWAYFDEFCFPETKWTQTLYFSHKLIHHDKTDKKNCTAYINFFTFLSKLFFCSHGTGWQGTNWVQAATSGHCTVDY